MEYLTGILVTFPKDVHKLNNHRELANKYRGLIRENSEEIRNIYARSQGYLPGEFEQFECLFMQFCTKSVLDELDAILAFEHPSNEYRHMELENGIRVIYATGRIAYMLRLALAFGYGPALQIKESYDM